MDSVGIYHEPAKTARVSDGRGGDEDRWMQENRWKIGQNLVKNRQNKGRGKNLQKTIKKP